MTVVTTIRIDEELKRKIAEKAKADNRSVNNWIITVLQKAVQD